MYKYAHACASSTLSWSNPLIALVCVCVCVCMYVCMHTYFTPLYEVQSFDAFDMYTCIHVYKYVHTHIHKHMCTCKIIPAHICTCFGHPWTRDKMLHTHTHEDKHRHTYACRTFASKCFVTCLFTYALSSLHVCILLPYTCPHAYSSLYVCIIPAHAPQFSWPQANIACQIHFRPSPLPPDTACLPHCASPHRTS